MKTKLTTRLKRGRKTEWWVLEGGSVRHTVAEISRELTGGVKMQYRPYLLLTEKPGPDGEEYTLRSLQPADTLDEAVENEAVALREKAGCGLREKPAVAEVTDRVTFIGVGMTKKKADAFADGIRRRLKEEPRS